MLPPPTANAVDRWWAVGANVARFLTQSVHVGDGKTRLDRAADWLRRRWGVAAAAVVLCAIALAWALWPSSAHQYAPEARARQFSQTRICVLTDSHGITSPVAAPVWSGVDDASKATQAQGSYIAVPSPDTPQSATVYVNSLTSRKCTLIVVTGANEVAAVHAQASKHTDQHFVVVGASGPSAANVETIAAGDASAVRSAVASVVENAAHGEFGSS